MNNLLNDKKEMLKEKQKELLIIKQLLNNIEMISGNTIAILTKNNINNSYIHDDDFYYNTKKAIEEIEKTITILKEQIKEYEGI